MLALSGVEVTDRNALGYTETVRIADDFDDSRVRVMHFVGITLVLASGDQEKTTDGKTER